MPSEGAETCANPLLLEWLKESWDLARERNTKAAHGYKKAYESMKACPLTFNHPSEANQLNGIGEKLCNRLTEQLERYCQANGLPMPKKARGNAKKRVSGDEENLQSADPPASKKARKPKPYVPTRGTGPYAIIIALSTVPEHSTQSLTKAQLIEMAQPYCTSSFTVGEAGKIYTAWKSMTTLVNKDLVQERGRPLRRYALTEDGWETAKRIRAVEKGQLNAATPEIDLSRMESGTSNPSRHAEDCERSPAFAPGSRAFQVEGNLMPPVAPVHEGNAVPKPASSGQRLGIAPNDPFQTFTRPQSGRDGSSSRDNVVDLISSPEQSPKQTRRFGHIRDPAERSLPPDETNEHRALDKEPRMPSADMTTFAAAPGTLSSVKSKLPEFAPITLKPGSFSIKLQLDSREVRQKGEDGNWISQELARQNTPNDRRALPLGDALWVAEIHDEAVLATHGEPAKVIVLDWIVERKRLDDLISSIMDGRFSEQKSRLWRSGIKNVTYLIEEFALSKDTADKFGERMASAIASTQVLHGYFVKQTRNLDESLRYLAQMTATLRSVYESQPLHIIPSTAVDSQSYLPLRDHLRTAPEHQGKNFGITMDAFEALASKSDALTLRDVFLKMLMCTRGISADKALGIQKVWPTPRALVEAFERCSDETERTKLVERELGSLVGRSAIKGVLSTKVADIWGKA